MECEPLLIEAGVQSAGDGENQKEILGEIMSRPRNNGVGLSP